MTAKNAAIVAGLAIVAALVWLVAARGGDGARDPHGDGARDRDGSGGGARDPTGGAIGGGSAAARSFRPPIHVASGTGARDGAGDGSAEPAPPPAVPADAGPPAPAIADAFAAEPRDPVFARAHEAELARRLEPLPRDGVRDLASECRSRQCRITITAADDAALGRFVGQLEEPAALQGWASLIVLDAVTTTADGQRRGHVYAVFE